jgi:hypothetical protein
VRCASDLESFRGPLSEVQRIRATRVQFSRLPQLSMFPRFNAQLSHYPCLGEAFFYKHERKRVRHTSNDRRMEARSESCRRSGIQEGRGKERSPHPREVRALALRLFERIQEAYLLCMCPLPLYPSDATPVEVAEERVSTASTHEGSVIRSVRKAGVDERGRGEEGKRRTGERILFLLESLFV